MYLWSIQQESSESLRKYLNRFTEESNKVDGFDDGDAIAAIIEGLRMSDFLKSLVSRVTLSMRKLMARVKIYMGVQAHLVDFVEKQN